MTITLTDYPQAARVTKSGSDSEISVPVGTSLVIETTPGGEEILNETCPPGKVWTAQVIVEITETDV